MMRATTPGAFFLSLALHGTVALVALLAMWYVQSHTPPPPVIFELVAGPPDGQAHLTAGGGADAAPKVDYKPAPPLNLPTPAPEPETPKVAEAAKPVTPPKPKADPVIPNLTRAMKRAETKVVVRETKKMEAEAKARLEQERKMSIEKFRAEQAAKKSTSVPRIDGKGIADELRSAALRTGAGEGGKALSRQEQSELDTYISRLIQAVRSALNTPPGLSELKPTRVEFRIAADGTLSGVRVIGTSGNAEFDRAVIEAFASVGSIGPTPNGKGDFWAITFTPPDE